MRESELGHRRRSLILASLVSAVVLVSGVLVVPPVAQAASATSARLKAGQYIVTLTDAPAATYAGGVSGYAATRVARGKQLDARTANVKKYVAYLGRKQKALTTQVGATALYNYSLTLDGFSATLTADQATRLAASSSVASITPNRVLHVTAATSGNTSNDYLGVTTTGGTWDQVHATGSLGEGDGIVVGDLDTGIAPENASFAGSPLVTKAAPATSTYGDAPYINSSARPTKKITYLKKDGQTFTSAVSTGTGFTAADYSTKIIAARYFVDGFGARNIGTSRGEYLSGRDGAGHGSHTASTAAGDSGVDATVNGTDYGTISGIAPDAKIAMYKVCWTGATEADDACYENDIVSGIEAAVSDGVDVLNFSIGGGAAASTYSATDAAFLGATAAGVFVAAAAGNASASAYDDDSTVDNAAPWETTVASTSFMSSAGTPVPQLSYFSSHGPVLAAGSDILKPDISAPGENVLAAVANAPNAAGAYDFYSGTSMATPHITGLAALYLSQKPAATPAEITSAMVTTAVSTVDAAGNPDTDPFGQGAGEVHPLTYLRPGLVYLATETDYKRYVLGAGEATTATAGFSGLTAIDPSDLNVPSISIGDLVGSQTVTRTVTSTAAGDYTAAVALVGFTTTVSPSTLHFTAAGQSQAVSITFARTTATAGSWTTGSLTWQGASGSPDVRSQIALHPALPTSLSSTSVPVIAGAARVGSTVTATPGGFSEPTRDLALRYQWSANGAAIAGATGAAFAIPSSLFGQALAVTVTASYPGTALSAGAASASATVLGTDGRSSLTATAAPKVSGSVLLAHTVRASTGSWNVPSEALSFTYRWVANGKSIAGATRSTYRVGASRLGKKLGVIVTAHITAAATSASSPATVVKASSRTTISLSDSTITTRVKEKITIRVKATGAGKETGTIVVHYVSGTKTKKKTDAMHASDSGKIVVTLPTMKKGSYKIWAEYRGNGTVAADNSVKKKLTVRR